VDTDAPEQAEQVESELYRWTIRALYAAAIVLNVWMLVDQMNEANPTRLPMLRARAESWVRRTIAPLQAPGVFRRHANQVIFEATEIVQGA
jgi:hypothetical protein